MIGVREPARPLSDEKVGAALTVPRPRKSDGKFAQALSIMSARDAVAKHRNFTRKFISIGSRAARAAFRAMSAMLLSQASIRAPERVRMNPTSSGCSMKLIGTMTAPSRISA
jgi:hypothetical protein